MTMQDKLEKLAELERMAKRSGGEKRIQAQHGVLNVDLVAEIREERDRDNERVWRGEP